MCQVNAFISELAPNLIYSFQTTNNKFFKIQLGRLASVTSIVKACTLTSGAIRRNSSMSSSLWWVLKGRAVAPPAILF